MKKIDLNQIYDVIADQIMVMKDCSTKLDNKTFTREATKTKELSNAAGKLCAITGQQLWANEMGAQISVPGLGIEEGQIVIEKQNKVEKLLLNGR